MDAVALSAGKTNRDLSHGGSRLLQDLRSDSVASLAGHRPQAAHTGAEERPSDAESESESFPPFRVSKHRALGASVLGKVWKPTGQSQSIVAARRSPLTEFTGQESKSLDAAATLDTAQTDQSHPCRVPIVRIVRIVRVIGKKKWHDTLGLSLREVCPHRRESVVLRGGS
jgi:hypothetical protein